MYLTQKWQKKYSDMQQKNTSEPKSKMATIYRFSMLQVSQKSVYKRKSYKAIDCIDFKLTQCGEKSDSYKKMLLLLQMMLE